MDICKFARWFTSANAEPWDVSRVTVRDITGSREYLHREKRQATTTVNRCLLLFGSISNGYPATGTLRAIPPPESKSYAGSPLHHRA